MRMPHGYDLFDYTKRRPLIGVSMFMPMIAPQGLSYNAEEAVKQAYREVAEEPSLPEERFVGKVPIKLHRNAPYAGVTHIHPYWNGREHDVYSAEIGINANMPDRFIKRVAKHELRHMKSEKLVKYKDVDDSLATKIMESYAEYGGLKAALRKNNTSEALEILNTTPYPKAVLFGLDVDRHYISDRDGKAGYVAFIRDIYKNKSMAQTMDRYIACKKASYN